MSLVGSEITALALPLLAAGTLDASPIEMGVLAAANQVPFFLFSLPAGVWVDRLPRRPLLVGTDIGSFLLLLSVPLATPLGGPTFLQLCIVAFGVGTMAVVAEVAHYAYVPSVVGRDRLIECNSKLQISYSAAGAAGPGVAGALVQLLSAPLAVLADAVSFLVSAVLLRSIPRDNAPTPPSGEQGSIRRSVVAGMRALLGHQLLRAIIVASVPISFFSSGFLAIHVLYATRDLALDAMTIGAIFAAGGVGAISGAALAAKAAARFGVGRTIVVGWVAAGAATLVVPFAEGSTLIVVAVLVASKAVSGLAETVANIHQWTLRQVVTPDHLAGRVTAGHRFTVYGAAAAGAVAGGMLGSAIGLRSALLVCAAGATLSPLVALFSPLRSIRVAPDPNSAWKDARDQALGEPNVHT